MNDVPGGAYPFITIEPSVGEAYALRTDLGDGLLYGIDCRSSRRIGGGHVLDDRDVIELVTTA